MKFSLFYFSDKDGSSAKDQKYKLLLESAKFADKNGFNAVWTPERHFQPFGGLYPSPSILSAALAMVTERIQLRAGSVVLPLHNPIRVAEEWSVVDSLSKGRVGIAVASGWHPDDFVLSPEKFDNRKELMWSQIEVIQRLWKNETVEASDQSGNKVNISLFPKPLQPNLPIWVTSQSTESFVKAGKIGANILTSLLYGPLEEVEEKILLYRQSLAQHGHDPKAGQVAVMLHTFVGQDYEFVKQKVKKPFISYLKNHAGLFESIIKRFYNVDLQTFTEEDIDSLMAFGFERLFDGRVLIGTPETCLPMVERLKKAGVDEVACLIDFGIDFDSLMASLEYVNQLKNRCGVANQSRALLSR
ncbi:MAG TPA: siderophore biosynthesis protein [Cyanobacteria bacterium UBA8553]|nr:siderophore biosynthesis protein [Cyanobacteria bacterium UBA8553]HAJ59262.1 siderophore biosynthesis protein [Cyanobacteria bacterium UBA8543]